MNRIEKTVIACLALLLGVYLLLPTCRWRKVPAEDKRIALESNSYIRDYAVGKVKRLKSDIEKEEDEALDLSEKYPEAVAAAKKSDKIRKVWTKSELLGIYDSEIAPEIEEKYRKKYQSLKKISNKALKLGLDLRGGLSVLLEADMPKTEARVGHKLASDELAAGLKDDIEILRRRVDSYGVSEVDIHTQGTDQVVIEIPGTTDPERVNSMLNGSGSLLFALVDQDKTNSLYADIIENREKYIDENDRFISQQIEEGYTAYGFYQTDDYGIDVLSGFYVVNDNFKMDAKYITSVETAKDNITGQPVVNFVMSDEGGKLFYEITSKNINKPLAVVFDGRIKSVATIRAALSTNVQVSGFRQEEADELSLTLKSSALPVDLKVISTQTVGASLGEDTISLTLKAIIIGLVILALFMVIYYQLSGVISVCMLALNMFLVVAVLSSFGFTLTLTSIAGVILTIGMAADSSIIIFERIKEEMRKGATPYNAVKTAYKKATWTILDANITTMIAALVLSMLGSTAVKGFATTLAIGIVCTLLTMLFFSHIIFDYFVKEGTEKLYITFEKGARE